MGGRRGIKEHAGVNRESAEIDRRKSLRSLFPSLAPPTLYPLGYIPRSFSLFTYRSTVSSSTYCWHCWIEWRMRCFVVYRVTQGMWFKRCREKRNVFSRFLSFFFLSKSNLEAFHLTQNVKSIGVNYFHKNGQILRRIIFDLNSKIVKILFSTHFCFLSPGTSFWNTLYIRLRITLFMIHSKSTVNLRSGNIRLPKKPSWIRTKGNFLDYRGHNTRRYKGRIFFYSFFFWR